MIQQILGLALTSAILNAGTASGTLTVQGNTIVMRHAQAVAMEDGTRLVVSDVAIPASAVQDRFELMRLAREGKVNAIQFEIGTGKTSLSTAILSNKMEGSVSISTGLDPQSIPVFTSERMEGTLRIPSSKLGPMKYQYDVRFAADIAARVTKAAPTAQDTAAAAQAASAQAYLAFVAALRSGNKARMLELSSTRVRQMIDQPDFAEKLSFIQAMLPANIQVLKAEEAGDSATLTVIGTEDGKRKDGTVKLTRQSGKWCIERESWTSRS